MNVMALRLYYTYYLCTVFEQVEHLIDARLGPRGISLSLHTHQYVIDLVSSCKVYTVNVGDNAIPINLRGIFIRGRWGDKGNFFRLFVPRERPETCSPDAETTFFCFCFGDVVRHSAEYGTTVV